MHDPGGGNTGGGAREFFPARAKLRAETQGDAALTIESSDNREKEMREEIQRRFDANGKAALRLRDVIITTMSNFRRDWPMDTHEADASIDATGEFRRMLEARQADDLPRFA